MTFKQSPIYKPQVLCPSCGDPSDIDYCTIGYKYTWWCGNDESGKQYTFIINNDWSVESEPTGVVVSRTAVLLKSKPQKGNIFLVVKGTSFNDTEDDYKYLYEEHHCPTNILQDVKELIVDGNIDKHGLFEYVGKIEEYSADVLYKFRYRGL